MYGLKKLNSLKQEFEENYRGNAHIQEFIPKNDSSHFSICGDHLLQLHQFAQKNPIYHNSFDEKFANIVCTVYEGDINEYWLNSIKHASSCQPFYPTWMISAYFMSKLAHELGYKELIDIGSGDGRIAYCGKIFGLKVYSIEIDEQLVDLQINISQSTNQNFNPICDDAMQFDYAKLGLSKPLFFIGGLPQMGGDLLASGIIEKLASMPNLLKNTGIVFAGTHSKRQLSTNIENGGWGLLIEKYHLKIIKTISLPTVWTFNQKIQTPYIYTKFS